jgi:LuxR family transcriptional regulator, maltose regulon positive regulatory protein
LTTEVTFARTRIQPPRVRADLIHRPELEANLQQALAEQRLTLVIAPAGWGKTSCLARQLAKLPPETALAWLSADVDDDLQRFLAGLAAALEPLDLPWRVLPAALAGLLESERGIRTVADEIVNALTDSEVSRGLIVIDDTQRWREPLLFELLAAVIEHLPAHWGLVISSRVEPALPIARWRARGELAEFRQAALRFSKDEVSELLKSKGLATDSAEDLQQRTHGWAVGLRLMLSVGNLSEQGLGRSQRDVFDYLATEVLEHMSPEMQTFLLRCSVLPDLTRQRCAHVSALPDAQALFAQLEHEGLFITALDDAGETLRLHDLFRDFLQARLQRDHATEVPALLIRAADHEPNLLRSVTWLTSAGATDRAEAELTKRGPALLTSSGYSDVLRMLAMLPAQTVDANPDLSFLRGVCAMLACDFELLATAMSIAEQGYLAAGHPDKAIYASTWKYCGLFSTGRAAQAREGLERISSEHQPIGGLGAMVSYLLAYTAETEGRVDDVVPALGEMLAKLASAPDAREWQDVSFLVLMVLYPGATELFEQHVRKATARINQMAIATRLSLNHIRTGMCLGKGQLSQAIEHLTNADDDMEWLGRPRLMQQENNALHAYVHALSGHLLEARRSAELALSTLQRSPYAYQRGHAAFSYSIALRTYWILGDEGGIRQMHKQLHAVVDDWEWVTGPITRDLADGMVSLLDEQWELAERQLLAAAKRNLWANFCLGLIAQVLAAEAQRRQGNLDAASVTLQEILNEPHLPNVVGCALLAGQDTVRNLAGARWGKRLSLAEQAELNRWTTLYGRGDVEAQLEQTVLPAGLTAREAEVLDLITKGHSNKLIARDLSLSLFTVKRHVANILGKTELSSRTELATWWLSKLSIA